MFFINIYDFNVKTSDGEDFSLSNYKGDALLIVNTATKCGFASQFAGLEELDQTYKEKGFHVLGFPCNQFKNQEPVEDADMGAVCERDFGVTFPLFKKINVNGSDADPLYTFLTEEKKGLFGGKIKWNFTKFLINRDGEVVKRFAPQDKPEKIEKDIKTLF